MWGRELTADIGDECSPRAAEEEASAAWRDAARMASATALAGSRSGAWLLTDARGRPLAVSDAAQALLTTNLDVLRRYPRQLQSPSHPHLLADCLARAHATGSAAAALPRGHRLPLTMRCERLFDAAASGRVHLLITLRDPEAEALDQGLAQAMFGLTRAEARVAAALVGGQGTDQIAHALGVQTNTVLAHIKRTLTKTGATRQVELVSLLLRSAAMVTTAELATPANAGKCAGKDAHLACMGNDSRR